MTNISSLPKAELHLHLEGAAMPAMVERLARERGHDISGLIRDNRYVWRGFSEFLAAFDRAAAVFTRPEDYAALTRAVLEGLAAQNVIYAEFFISADHAAATGVSYPDYLAAISAEIDRAEAAGLITARLIPLCVRGLGPENAHRVAELAARHPHRHVVGFGMAGDERMHHPKDFASAFDIAREAGLKLTAHAGEFRGAESVRDALDHLKVVRVGHGVRAIEDASLVRRLAEEGIVLEVCPLSNVALEVYPDMAAHSFGRLRAAGVKVTLNTDDPPFFGSTMNREYAAAAAAYGLSEADLRAVTRTAIEGAFCDDATKARLLKRLDESAGRA